MRILLLTLGTRGDVQPFVALGIPGIMADPLPTWVPTGSFAAVEEQ